MVLKIENTGGWSFEPSAYGSSLVDTIGALSTPGFVSRRDKSTVNTPDLEDGNTLPGETVTGAVSYRVPQDAELTQAVYSGDNDGFRFCSLLADLSAGGVATPEARWLLSLDDVNARAGGDSQPPPALVAAGIRR